MATRALAVLVLLAAIASTGCGSSAAQVHSPAEVSRVFAAHGLALEPTEWATPANNYGATLVSENPLRNLNPRVKIKGSVSQAIVKGILGKTPPGHLALTINVWTSISVAKKEESIGNSRPPAGFPPSADKTRTSRVDNVTVFYVVSPSTVKLRARMLTTLAAVARTPGVQTAAG